MSDLTGKERRKLEKMFRMENGYVLEFSDHTFNDFFHDYGVEIDDERYKVEGTSKAKRLRAHWRLDENHIVGRTIKALIERENDGTQLDDTGLDLIDSCRRIANRLLSDQPVVELDTLNTIGDEKNYNLLTTNIRDAIDKGQPQAGLDRLHTFVVKYIRGLCDRHSIDIDRDRPLHSIMGQYVKTLGNAGYLESKMTEQILKSSINLFESFNGVRNNNSLAHDNPTLNREESLLIFNYVTATLRFIDAFEQDIKKS